MKWPKNCRLAVSYLFTPFSNSWKKLSITHVKTGGAEDKEQLKPVFDRSVNAISTRRGQIIPTTDPKRINIKYALYLIRHHPILGLQLPSTANSAKLLDIKTEARA